MTGEVLQCRAGKVDITPLHPVQLGGDSERLGPYEGIASRLEANLLILTQGDKHIFIYSLDILFVSDKLKSDLLQALSSTITIDPSQLMLCASHTHFAPSVDTTRSRLGLVDEKHYAYLLNQLTDCFKTTLLLPPAAATIHYKKVQAHHCVNRRRKAIILRKFDTYVFNQPNLHGFKVEDVYVIHVRSADGKSLAVCWSYACHPVSFPNKKFVSSEYIGIVRDEIRNTLSENNLPVIFLQGFAGDLRPLPLKRKLPLISLLRLKLQLPVYEDLITMGDYYPVWAKRLADVVLSGFQQMKQVENIQLSSRQIEMGLKDNFGMTSSEVDKVYMQCLFLSPGFLLFAVSAEVMAEYVPALKKIWNGAEVIPVGYINSVYGYWPTLKMTKEGGYESERFMGPFNLTGKWQSDIEKLFTRKVKEIKG